MRDKIETTIEKSQFISSDITKMKSEVKKYYYYLVDKLKIAKDLETKAIVRGVMKKIQQQLDPIDKLDLDVRSYLKILKAKNIEQVTDYEIAKELNSFNGKKNRMSYNFALVKKELKNALKTKDIDIFKELARYA